MLYTVSAGIDYEGYSILFVSESLTDLTDRVSALLTARNAELLNFCIDSLKFQLFEGGKCTHYMEVRVNFPSCVNLVTFENIMKGWKPYLNDADKGEF